jgi:hypothetical protein
MPAIRQDPKAPIQYDGREKDFYYGVPNIGMNPFKMMSLPELRNHISQYNKFYNIRNQLVALLEKTVQRFAPLGKDVPKIIPKKLVPKDTSKITNLGGGHRGKGQRLPPMRRQRPTATAATQTPIKRDVKLNVKRVRSQ